MEIIKWFVKLRKDVEIIIADVTELIAHVTVLIADITLFWKDLSPYKLKIQKWFDKFKRKRK